MEHARMEAESDIARWYRGKGVFITGATGFMGKVLVEKLLRSCPDVGSIYVLVREKKKMRPRDRLDEIMTSPVFDKVRATLMERKDSVVPIPGEVSLPGLGISDEHRHLLENSVSVVFHLAATVRFDETLRIAVGINLVGTKTLMEFCLKMTRLSALVHVSTAYTNCCHSKIGEHIYPPPADLEKIMHCVASMDDNLLETETPRLIGDHPNTYTFTKALAEQIVAGYCDRLPIVVVRPSIVVATLREPIPGWLDNFNGPTGLVVGGCKGLTKSVYGKALSVADLIPVDPCVNLFIAAAWETGTRECMNHVPNVRVYNCVSGPFKSITWHEFIPRINRCMKKYPTSDVITTPKLSMTDNRVIHTLKNVIQIDVPIFLAHMFIRCSGRTSRLQHYRRKLIKVAKALEFFTTHEFQFAVDNTNELKQRLNPADQEIFNFDITNINWDEYVTTYFLGIRKYLLKEEEDAHTIPSHTA